MPQPHNTNPFFDETHGHSSSVDYKSAPIIERNKTLNKTEVYNIDYWKNNKFNGNTNFLENKSSEDISVVGHRHYESGPRTGLSIPYHTPPGLMQGKEPDDIRESGSPPPNDPETIQVMGYRTKLIRGKHYLLSDTGNGFVTYQNARGSWSPLIIEDTTEEINKDTSDILGRASNYSDIKKILGTLASGRSYSDIRRQLSQTDEAKKIIEDTEKRITGGTNDAYTSWVQDTLGKNNDWNLTEVQKNLANSPAAKDAVEKLQQSIIGYVNNDYTPWATGSMRDYQDWDLDRIRQDLANTSAAKDKINSFYQALKGRPIDDTNLAIYRQTLANGGPVPGTIMAAVFAQTGASAFAGDAAGAAASVLLGESFFGPLGWAAVGATLAGIEAYNNWEVIRSEWDSLRSALSQAAIPIEAIQRDLGLQSFAYQAKEIAKQDTPAIAIEAQDAAARRNCRIQYVTEPDPVTPSQKRGRAYEDQGPNGRLIDPKSGLSIKPALMYNKDKLAGADFVKFDNFQILPNGLVEVIDRKKWVPAIQKSTGVFAFPDTIDQFRRQSAALEQNPGCIGVHHVPNETERAVDEAILRSLDIGNIRVEVHPFY